MKTVRVMLGGPEDHLPEGWALTGEQNCWVGVDRGALRLIQNGIFPELALGDFDSVSEEEFLEITQHAGQIVRVKAEKDDTDAELAVEEAFETLGADQVILYGGTGGRLDHLFSVLFFPAQPRFFPYAEKTIIKDQQNTVAYFLPGQHVLSKEPDKPYVSFVVLTPVKSLTLEGLKYPLTGKDVSHPYAYVSNEFLKESAQFSFKEGLVAVIQSKD